MLQSCVAVSKRPTCLDNALLHCSRGLLSNHLVLHHLPQLVVQFRTERTSAQFIDHVHSPCLWNLHSSFTYEIYRNRNDLTQSNMVCQARSGNQEAIVSCLLIRIDSWYCCLWWVSWWRRLVQICINCGDLWSADVSLDVFFFAATRKAVICSAYCAAWCWCNISGEFLLIDVYLGQVLWTPW